MRPLDQEIGEPCEVCSWLATTMHSQRDRGMHDAADGSCSRARPLLAPRPGGAALPRTRGILRGFDGGIEGGFHGSQERNGGECLLAVTAVREKDSGSRG